MPRSRKAQILVCLAVLLGLSILGGCSAGVSDGGEMGGGGAIGGGGNGGGGGGGNNNPPPDPEPIPVVGTSATLSWNAASGPVAGYKVLVSRNGGAFAEENQTSGTSVTLMGAAGEVLRMRVAAFDANASVGATSPTSEPFVFLGGTSASASTGEGAGEPAGDAGVGAAGGSVAGGADGSSGTAGSPADPGDGSDTGAPSALAGDDLVWQSQDGAFVRVTSADLTRARIHALPDAGRRLVAVADFDGDGADDLLFAAPGALSLARGSALAAGPGALALEPWAELPAGADFAASGDFDGDGSADAVVVASGNASLWLAAGDVLALPAVASGARLLGAGDADGDGYSDLLWAGADDSLVLWRVVAGAPAGESPVTLPEGAAFVAFADLDANGAAEIASQGAPDALGVSQAVAPFSGWVEAAPSGASLAGCGDYDGDGTRDRLWVDATGLRVAAASGETAVPAEQLGSWRLLSDCE